MYDTTLWKVISFINSSHRFDCKFENFIPGKFTLELVVHVARDRLIISSSASCCALACYCMPIIILYWFSLLSSEACLSLFKVYMQNAKPS